MTDANKPGALFWVIGIIGLIWDGWGAVAYIQQAYGFESVTAGMTAEQIAFMDARPAWVTALFAIAVFSGVIGCILFLMRKKLSASLLMLSFLAALIMELYYLFGTNASELFDAMSATVMPILVIVIAGILAWYSKNQKSKGVLS